MNSKSEKRSILLVEDERATALLEKKRLEQYGYRVKTVSTGEEAVRVFQQNENIDLVLMDIDLGEGMDGTEAASVILEIRDIPIVFLSSHVEKEVVEKTEKITSYGYVVKNTGITVLDASIKMAFKLFEANKRMEEQKQHLATTLNSIGDAVIATDVSGLVTHINPVTERLIGWKNGDALGYPLTDVFHIVDGSTGKRADNPVEKVLKADDAIEMGKNTLLIALDGRTFQIADSAAPIRDSDGTITGVVLVFRDVTEEYSMLQRIEESESRFRNLFEQSGDGVLIHDLEGNILDVNQTLCELSGYTEEELLEMNLFSASLLTTGDESIARNALDKLLEYGEVRFEAEFTAKQGKNFYIEVNSAIVEIGDRKLIQAVFRDITRRRWMEKALRESEERYRALYDTANDAILIIDDNAIISCNETAVRLFGYGSNSDIVGCTPWDLSPDTQPDGQDSKDKAKLLVNEALNERIRYFEWKHRTRDGLTFDAEISLNKLELEGETCLLAIVRDITERKRTEKEREEYLRELEFINETLLETGEMDDVGTICRMIGEKVKSVNRDAIVVVSLFDESINAIRIRDIQGISGILENLVRIIGFDPLKIHFSRESMISDTSLYSTGRMEKLPGGIYDILEGKVPKPVCTALEKMFGYSDVYTVGFSLDDRPSGGITLFLPGDRGVRHIFGIETVARHASLMIYRLKAEKRIRHLNRILQAIRNVNQLITQEKDAARLIQKACDALMESRSYHNAWILLLDEEREVTVSAEAGIGEDFNRILDSFRKGDPPHCIIEVLESMDMTVVDESSEACGDCFLRDTFEGSAVMSIPLESEGRLLGILTVTMPAIFAADRDDQNLFHEVADDLAFALQGIETEEKLHYSNHIVSTMPHLLAFISPDYRYLSVNESYGRYFNLPVEDIQGQRVSDVVGIELFETEIRPRLDRCLAGESVRYRFQVEVPGRGGRWMEREYFPYHGREGIVSGVVVHGQDITEQVKSEYLYRMLVESASVAILLHEPDGKFIEVNQVACEWYGYSREEMLQLGPADIDTPEAWERNRELLPLIMGKGEHIFESQHVKKDGTVVPVEISSRLVDYQGRKTVISHVRDLSFRKKTERELRERYHHEEYLALCSRDLLKGEIDSLESALGRLLVAADVSRVYIFENFEGPEDGLCMRQTHEAVAEGVPSEFDNEQLQHVSYSKDGFLRWQRELSRGESVSGNIETFPESEREVLEPQGIVSMLVIPILVEGEWFGFVGFDELRGKREWNLEEVRLLRVGAEMIGNYIERKLYEDRIANLLAEKDLILHEIHHRIKNNMNTMKNLLSLQSDRSDDPAVRLALETAENRMTGMMVLYDRLYRGESIQEVSLRDYLTSLVKEIIDTFDTDVSLVTEIDDIDISARQAAPLGILVNELITNAMKYAFSEGKDNRLGVRAAVRESNVRLMIADNGEGIPEGAESRGFGLDLVRALVGQMEGSFRIEQDGGTRCVLEFTI